MNHFELKYKRYGEQSILVEWPQKIDDNILGDVLRFKKILQNHYVKESVYVNNAYCSLLINYNFYIENIYDKLETLKQLYSTNKLLKKKPTLCWKIPVCYDAIFGIDLQTISNQIGQSKEAIIALHSSAVYTVFFTGFLPGFLYLGGLNRKLQVPRRPQPRLHVEKGSVAIGGYQTGVYPSVSPGGWNIIGNSPINFFEIDKEKPCFASSGDKIQFVPISLEEHIDIMILVESGVYQIESEVLNG